MLQLLIVFKFCDWLSCDFTIGFWKILLATCAYGSDFGLCPILMCSCAWSFLQAFAELLYSPVLVLGQEVGHWSNFVLGVDLEEEQEENPALLAQSLHGDWSDW